MRELRSVDIEYQAGEPPAVSTGSSAKTYENYAAALLDEGTFEHGDHIVAGIDSFHFRTDIGTDLGGIMLPSPLSLHPSDPIKNGLLILVSRLARRHGWVDGQTVTTFTDELGCVWTQLHDPPGSVTYHATGGPNNGPYLNIASGSSGFVSVSDPARKCGRNKGYISAITHMKPASGATNNDYYFQIRNNADSAMRFGLKFDGAPTVAMGRESGHSEWNAGGQAYTNTSKWLSYGGIGFFDGPQTRSFLGTTKMAAISGIYDLGEFAPYVYNSGFDLNGGLGTGPTADTDAARVLLWANNNTAFAFFGQVSCLCLMTTVPGELLTETMEGAVQRWLGYQEGYYAGVSVSPALTFGGELPLSAPPIWYGHLPSPDTKGQLQFLRGGSVWQANEYWVPHIENVVIEEMVHNGNVAEFDMTQQDKVDITSLGWAPTGDVIDGVREGQGVLIFDSGDEDLIFDCGDYDEVLMMIEWESLDIASSNNTSMSAYWVNGEKVVVLTCSQDGEKNLVAVPRRFDIDGQEGSYEAQPYERLFWHVRRAKGNTPGFTRVINTRGEVVSLQEWSDLVAGTGGPSINISTATNAGHRGAVRRFKAWVCTPKANIVEPTNAQLNSPLPDYQALPVATDSRNLQAVASGKIWIDLGQWAPHVANVALGNPIVKFDAPDGDRVADLSSWTREGDGVEPVDQNANGDFWLRLASKRLVSPTLSFSSGCLVMVEGRLVTGGASQNLAGFIGVRLGGRYILLSWNHDNQDGKIGLAIDFDSEVGDSSDYADFQRFFLLVKPDNGVVLYDTTGEALTLARHVEFEANADNTVRMGTASASGEFDLRRLYVWPLA